MGVWVCVCERPAGVEGDEEGRAEDEVEDLRVRACVCVWAEAVALATRIRRLGYGDLVRRRLGYHDDPDTEATRIRRRLGYDDSDMTATRIRRRLG